MRVCIQLTSLGAFAVCLGEPLHVPGHEQRVGSAVDAVIVTVVVAPRVVGVRRVVTVAVAVTGRRVGGSVFMTVVIDGLAADEGTDQPGRQNQPNGASHNDFLFCRRGNGIFAAWLLGAVHFGPAFAIFFKAIALLVRPDCSPVPNRTTS